MSPDNKQQTMKPLTAANKLGIYLPATPEDFRNDTVTRAQLDALRADPPEWLSTLWAQGPYPRDVIARKLGVSIAGLGRAGVTDALSADEIAELIGNPPEWLVRERKTQADVRAESERIKEKEAARKAAANRPPKLR